MGGEAPGPPHVPGLFLDYMNYSYVLHELYNYCMDEWEAKHPGRHTCQARAAAFNFRLLLCLCLCFVVVLVVMTAAAATMATATARYSRRGNRDLHVL